MVMMIEEVTFETKFHSRRNFIITINMTIRVTIKTTNQYQPTTFTLTKFQNEYYEEELENNPNYPYTNFKKQLKNSILF